MKIAVDLSSLEDHLSGLERYGMCLTRAMLRLDTENEYVLVFKNQIHPAFFEYQKKKNITCVVRDGKNKLFFNQFLLPSVMKKTKAEVFLFPAFPVPYFFREKNTYGLIADTCFLDCPETMTKKSALFFKVMASHTAKMAQKVITISHFSQKQIGKHYPKAKGKILLLECGVDTEEKKSGTLGELQEKYGLPKEYLLSLATIEPRKNMELLLTAYEEVSLEYGSLPPLVMAGRIGWKMEQVMERYKNTNGRILFPGFISEDDLKTLYQNATLFVSPSSYEGFGMPALEAQQSGCKAVLLSDIEAHKEVFKDTVRYFENNNKEDLKQAFRQFAEGKWQEKEIVSSEKNLQYYRWERSAKKLLDSITENSN